MNLRQRSQRQDSRPPQLLDEDEQDAVIQGFQRSADRSNKVFRAIFAVIGIVVFIALALLAIRSSSVTAPSSPLQGSRMQHHVTDDIRALCIALTAVGVASAVAKVMSFEPSPTMTSGAPSAMERIRRSVWIRISLVQSTFAIGYFELWKNAGASLDWVALVWWLWPVPFHAFVAAYAAWLQEAQDGIEALRASKYRFKKA